jgi:hypothetical protein
MHEWTIQRLATIDTQDTGKGNKQTNPTTQQRKLIRWSTRTSPKTGMNPGVREVPSSYKTPVMLLV